MPIADRARLILLDRRDRMVQIERDSRLIADGWKIPELLSELKELLLAQLGDRIISIRERAIPLHADIAVNDRDKAGLYLELVIEYHPFSNLTMSDQFSGIKMKPGNPRRYELGTRGMKESAMKSAINDIREVLALVTVTKDISSAENDFKVTMAVKAASRESAYLIGGINVPEADNLENIMANIWTVGLPESFPTKGKRTTNSARSLKYYLDNEGVRMWYLNKIAREMIVGDQEE